MGNKKTITLLKCELCNHNWYPRTTKPIQCPKCKVYKWDIPRKKSILKPITKQSTEQSTNKIVEKPKKKSLFTDFY